ncbi:response regulator transcription factor [Paenibacillus ginsengarvi]|uniref:DNA-binding response regulator n=1 Tax=Paenibacillus ginsengarvi TaxID=400777 RepID=A0A3B0CIV5_9BACL|nr:response regulator transcription factor [Paenibacillus ginsengarvi]RKN84771.1 DNA-binding response regulator [Paenibacillus ginsengarvi]
MGKTILIVEDEAKMRRLLADYLRHEGYMTIEAANGQEALERFDPERIDLVLLDIMMPFMDGFAACKAIRRQSGVLIVLLTAKSEEYDKLQGYDLGADDYVTKPFSPKVLIAKIRALFKRLDDSRASGGGSVKASNSIQGLELDPDAHEVRVDGRAIPFTRKEYELLLYLYQNPNITLSRDQILNQVWGYDYDGDMRTVDTHIKRLRQKLEHKAELIATIKGYGYKFEVKR